MKSRISRLFFAIFLMLHVAVLAMAQEPAYLHYDVSDGLPSSLVYRATQDHNGFMWFGTDKGLVRFDGMRFKVFGMKDGLPDLEVLNVMEDSQHRLWLSCFQNNPCYMKDGVIYTFETDTMLRRMDLHGGVFNFSEDINGNFWVTGDPNKYCKISPKNELSIFDSPVDHFNFLVPPERRRQVITVEDVISMNGKQFVIGQQAILNTSNKDSIFCEYIFDGISITDEVISLTTSGNYLLISLKETLLLLEYKDNKFNKLDTKENNASSAIFTDSKGNFWASSQKYGAICYNQAKHDLSAKLNLLSDKKITNTFEDNEGNFWFTTLNEGIFVLPRNASLRYTKETTSTFASNNFLSLSKLSDGSIMAGDDSGNLYQKKGNEWIRKSYGTIDGYNRVLNINPLPNNEWLAVSEEALLSSIIGRVNHLKFIGAFKSIFSVKDTVWVGTSSFLTLLPNLHSEPVIILQNRTTNICADSGGNIWAGGLNGLFSQKDGFKINWGDKFPILSKRIMDMEKAGKNELWVATTESGLVKVAVSNGKILSTDMVNSHLKYPIENIQSIYSDVEDMVWVSTNNGVYGIDSEYNVQHFNENNGLLSNNANATIVVGDTLWVATAAGISYLKLGVTDTLVEVPTHIVGVNYQLEQASMSIDFMELVKNTKKITIPTSATMLEIRLAALIYRTRGNLRFEFAKKEKLLPLHLITWKNLFKSLVNYFNSNSEITIVHEGVKNLGVNVEPGRQFCTVTSILPSGIRSTNPDQITITILPHWWQPIWVSLIAFTLAIVGIVRIFKARAAFLKLQATASELQLQAIKSQMNPHFVGNSINAIQQFFYPPDPLKASEYISTFSDLLRRTMAFAEVNFIPFEEELQYVKDYLEMVKLRFGDHFSYSITGADTIGKNSKFPTMLLQPILENATIHGLSPNDKSELKVHFAKQSNFIYCTVTDNGVGIEESLQRKSLRPKTRPSKGIALLEKKIQMLNQLHDINLKVTTVDLRKLDASGHGTQVVISFLETPSLKPNLNNVSA